MAGQRHFRKEQNIDAAGAGGVDYLQMLAQIRVKVAENRFGLRDRDV